MVSRQSERCLHNAVPRLFRVQPQKPGHPRNIFQIDVNPFTENCFQKYFGRVITNASALSPAFFVASTLMELWWNFVELFFLQYVIISRRHSDLSPCVALNKPVPMGHVQLCYPL